MTRALFIPMTSISIKSLRAMTVYIYVRAWISLATRPKIYRRGARILSAVRIMLTGRSNDSETLFCSHGLFPKAVDPRLWPLYLYGRSNLHFDERLLVVGSLFERGFSWQHGRNLNFFQIFKCF